MKKPSQKTLRNKADRLFSRMIRERDAACQSCGSRDGLQCAHVFSRRYLKVRWNPDNAMALCSGCHVSFTHNPIAWEDFCIKRLGEKKYRELRAAAIDVVGKVDYIAIIEELEAA